MIKPASLRAALVAALPIYAVNPDKLVLYIDKGRLVSRLTAGLGYEWRYTVRLEFHDCTAEPDAIAIPLLLWLRENQPERLLEFEREDSALGFAADIIDGSTWDLAWAFELSEPVALRPKDGGGWDVTHLPEPTLADEGWLTGAAPDTLVGEIWLGDRLIVTR